MQHTLAEHTDFFEPAIPLVVGRAPGRLDVIGGIADYSGALVLELPLGVAALVAAQPSPNPTITIRSLQADSIAAQAEYTLALAELAPGGTPLSYAAAQALFAAHPESHWAAYLAGALIVLAHECGIVIERGMRLLLDSQVPLGKGVSSSAAIEVAAMQAIAALYEIDLPGRELAILCQKVENLVVGAPCGVMDQMTSACGMPAALLALRCQPAELEPAVAIPAHLEVWGLDSGIRHAVSGADYGSVRVGAFMGYRIIADLAGLAVQLGPDSSVLVEDPYWGGYLANIGPSIWAERFAARVPEVMGGAEFLARYGGTTDRVTRVDPARQYPVRQPTAHPIEEHQRVRMFRALLQAGAQDQESRVLLGELMYQAHTSYSLCGLGSDGTDQIVALVRAAGPTAGLYGAKITGGGSGGTVAILAERGAEPHIRAIAEAYQRQTGRVATLLHGSSPGAKAFDVVWMQHDAGFSR
jgi:L-arabinokinase